MTLQEWILLSEFGNLTCGKGTKAMKGPDFPWVDSPSKA